MFTVKPKLCLNNIYKQISEEQILKHLFPYAKKNTQFSIRSEKNKSASIIEYRGRLYIKDFGDSSQPKAETWYQYVARINGYSINTTQSFLLSLHWANSQFNLNLEKPYFHNLASTKKIVTIKEDKEFQRERLPVKIEVQRGKWTKKYLDYWKQFNLDNEWLNSKYIAPLNFFWVTNPNKDGIRYEIDCRSKITFCYYYGKENGVNMYKIYSPLEINFKWVSNVNSHIIENWRFLKTYRENVIIQSSLKDIGVMEYFRDVYGIFKEYDFISPISAGIWFNGNWEMLKNKYNKIIYYGNNDNTDNNPGLNYARKWSNQFNIPFIINPDNRNASDISDYRKANGEIKTKELLIEIEDRVNNYL